VHVAHAEKATQLRPRQRMTHLRERLQILVVQPHLPGGYDVPEVLDGLLEELAILGFQSDASPTQVGQNFVERLYVVLRGVGEDDDIVEADKPRLPGRRGQDDVKGTLEGRGSVGEADGHLQVLIRAHVASESGFVDVVQGHWYLSITGIAVER